MRRVVLLAPLALVLAACGGGGGTTGSGNPLVDAAKATAEAVSEAMTTSATVSYPGTAFTFAGAGAYDHATDEGYQHLRIELPGAIAEMDEIFIKSVMWMKSKELISTIIPKGMEWLKYDVNTAGQDSGFNFKSLFGQTPADMLKELERTQLPVTTVGTETVGGEDLTHYRAAIDPKKTPTADNLQALSRAEYKPVEVWVDGDKRVRKVILDYTAKIDPAKTDRAHVRLTMTLADFGVTVEVDPPDPSLVVDATANSGQTG